MTLTVFFIQSILLQGQNLVFNPSFEDTVQCPVSISQMYASGWYSPTWGTPDYYNNCNNGWMGVPQNFEGWEFAKTGVAYAGIVTRVMDNGREYIQSQLTDTLVAGFTYNVSFYVSLTDSSEYACNNIGAYLSSIPVNASNNLLLPYAPQIVNNPIANPLLNSNGWTFVTDTFIALGNELYITIGNFNTAATNDTIYVGGPSTNPHFAYYYIDDVKVWSDMQIGVNENDAGKSFSIFPNPSANNFTLSYSSPVQAGVFEMYDVYGKLCVKNNLDPGKQSMEINTSSLNNGIYYCRLKTGNDITEIKKIVIAK
jgi:hypothetical protein